MNKSFEDILSKILEEKNKYPDKKIEEAISSIYTELGISEDIKEQLHESCDTIDQIESICKEIKEAKKDGLSKEEWIMETIDELTAGMNLTEADQFANGILDGIETTISQTGISAENEIEQINNSKKMTNEQDNTVDNIR